MVLLVVFVSDALSPLGRASGVRIEDEGWGMLGARCVDRNPLLVTDPPRYRPP